ncbi:MAG: FkbM family methyltransferase [Dokdonella sp.]
MTPELERLRRVWQTLGRDDPLWAVLSHADKRSGRWKPDEFLATGQIEIDTQLAALAAAGYPKARGLALDFGCGAGRLTRALAGHFVRVIGLDVAASMIETAKLLNADLGNVDFRVNASAHIDAVTDGSVDFVFSHMVLQHIPGALATAYVDEFLRVLAPGGVAAFQFVDGVDDSPRGRLYGMASNRWLNPLRQVMWRRRDVFEMHSLPEDALLRLLERHPSMRLLHAMDDGSAGAGWRGRRWIVANEAAMPERIACDGYVIYADPTDLHIGAPLLGGHVHESHVATVLRERVRKDDVVLDIGGNIGILALLAASLVGPQGRVVVVEPIPHNRSLLERSARASGFDHLRVLAGAAGDRAGVLELRTHPSTSNSATPAASGDRLRAPEGVTVRVPLLVLDDALPHLERLDLVKIDIEGMEPLAMRGLERTLARFRPTILSEFHPWAIERATRSNPVDYLGWLRRFYPAITILHRDGTRERHTDPQRVMTAWKIANDRAGADGRLHLDLLIEP